MFKATRDENPDLDVWALAENKRPSADTQLYHAPFLNITGDGYGVCLGTTRSKELAQLKKTTPSDWEHVFFDSNFSHSAPRIQYEKVIGKEKAAPAGNDNQGTLDRYACFISALAKAKAFPIEALVPFRGTLGSIL